MHTGGFSKLFRTSGFVENATVSCWVYPIDLFFSVSSSAWTAVMAFHLVASHYGVYKNERLEIYYAYVVLIAASAITVPITAISGGYVNTVPPTPG